MLIETPENWETVEMTIQNVMSVKISEGLIDKEVIENSLGLLVKENNEFKIKELRNE